MEWMNRYTVIFISLICGLLAAAGCKRQTAGTGPALSPECVVLDGTDERPDTIRIALPGRVDPANAPLPRSDSERILFGHLYETLITVDCEGKVHPGLAAEWYDGDGGRRWTFRLRRGARFQDGSPVTAQDIVDCWQSAGIEPDIWEAGVDSVAAAGENIVHIYFMNTREELPRELTAPPFAVARIGDRWPHGSTPCKIDIEQSSPGPMHRRTITLSPVSGSDGPVLVFLEPGSSAAFDPRDLLEGTVDVMITRDPDIIEYARTRSHLETVPLPWSRIYLLLSTSRVREIRLGDTPAGIDREFSDGLARDAVPGVARGHVDPEWWGNIDFCATLADGADAYSSPVYMSYRPESNDSRRIVFSGRDAAARNLAERIVGLGAAGPDSSPGAAKLAAAVPGLMDDQNDLSVSEMPEEEMGRSLAAGDEFAYIISIPFHPADPCLQIRQLRDSADWLSQLGDGFADAMLPLVDTRSHAIVRKGTAGLTVDWYGNVYIEGALNRPAAPPGR